MGQKLTVGLPTLLSQTSQVNIQFILRVDSTQQSFPAESYTFNNGAIPPTVMVTAYIGTSIQVLVNGSSTQFVPAQNSGYFLSVGLGFILSLNPAPLVTVEAITNGPSSGTVRVFIDFGLLTGNSYTFTAGSNFNFVLPTIHSSFYVIGTSNITNTLSGPWTVVGPNQGANRVFLFYNFSEPVRLEQSPFTVTLTIDNRNGTTGNVTVTSSNGFSQQADVNLGQIVQLLITNINFGVDSITISFFSLATGQTVTQTFFPFTLEYDVVINSQGGFTITAGTPIPDTIPSIGTVPLPPTPVIKQPSNIIKIKGNCSLKKGNQRTSE